MKAFWSSVIPAKAGIQFQPFSGGQRQRLELGPRLRGGDGVGDGLGDCK